MQVIDFFDSIPAKSPPTVIRLGSGKLLDIYRPEPALIDLEMDVVQPLSKEPRFAGQTPGVVYSVAEHCVLGAAAVLLETGSVEAALAFLLHDAHEAIFTDLPSPVAETLGRYLGKARVKDAIARVKAGLDLAIAEAAEVPTEISPEARAIVHVMDSRMLRAEQRAWWRMTTRSWPTPFERLRASLITYPQGFLVQVKRFQGVAPAPVELDLGLMAPMPPKIAAEAWRNALTDLRDALREQGEAA